MFLFDIFRSFLPLHNPIGFGASDFVEFALVTLLVLLVPLRARIEPAARRFAERTGWCMLLLFALPVVLRLALLPHFPVPTPGGADDYSYLLLADTLRHFRLANPMHPMHRFFETVFVLQEPAYASIYSPGQGLVLAIGWNLFGHPWAGVVLGVAAFCSLCYWMLRGWTSPGWALAGGLLAVCEFGPLNEWMNIYWGGAVTAAAGCLVFGSLPRLRQCWRQRDAVLLGLGLGMHLLTRPYESIFLALSVILYFRPLLWQRTEWKKLAQTAGAVALVVLPAIALTLAQAKAVTGSWTTIPYAHSRYQYGVPTTFTWQPSPEPHRELTTQQTLTYLGQSEAHGNEPETFGRYLERWGCRLRFYRFFFLAPLYVAMPFFVLRRKESRLGWVAGTILLFSLGTNFYPYFFPQYVAGLTCLFVVVAIAGLQKLSGISAEAARWIVLLAAAHFLFWYGMHAWGNENIFLAMRPYETWDFVNFGDPEERAGIAKRLEEIPGKKLVFVRYGPQHRFREWIHNAANIDASPVVMALDLGPENDELRRYCPDRSIWLLEPDARPVRLVEYSSLHESR